mgnify:CR=1 FL=1
MVVAVGGIRVIKITHRPQFAQVHLTGGRHSHGEFNGGIPIWFVLGPRRSVPRRVGFQRSFELTGAG